MITISGKEGGGQMLRTALGLAAITGKQCTITDIRAGRANPGLAEQHLQCVLAMQELCNAEVQGAKLASQTVRFEPNRLKKGDLSIKIRTAGSIGLLLQSLLIPAVETQIDLTIRGGGTWNKWAPPVYHLHHVLFPLLRKMAYNPGLTILQHGFFPKGGAKVDVYSPKGTLTPLHILEKGQLKKIRIRSIATQDLEKKQVAERQAASAEKIINAHFHFPIEIETEYVDALNAGSGIHITVETEHSIFGGDMVGEKKKLAEDVGSDAALSLIASYERGTVDIHTADMLLPYIAVAGGSYIAPEITNHIKTNVRVIEQFLSVKFSIKGRVITVEKTI
jgi:RNA 3'-phosphate cyclase